MTGGEARPYRHLKFETRRRIERNNDTIYKRIDCAWAAVEMYEISSTTVLLSSGRGKKRTGLRIVRRRALKIKLGVFDERRRRVADTRRPCSRYRVAGIKRNDDFYAVGRTDGL